MKSSWVRHLKTKEEQDKFIEYIKSSSGVLDRLAELIKEKETQTQVFKKEDYSSPSWAYEAADRNGYVRALQELLELLTP